MAAITTTKEWDARASSTLEKFNNVVRDQIFKGLPVLDFMLQSGRVRRVPGGRRISEAVLYEGNQNFEPYEHYDVVATAPSDGATRAFYKWRLYNIALTISEQEIDENAGNETKLFDLLKFKIKQAEKSMRDGLATDLFATQAGKRLDGLGGIISTTANTVGEIDETTNTWWAPQRNTSALDALGLRGAMRTMYNDVLESVDPVSEDKLVIVTTQAIHEAYEDQLQDTVRLRYEQQNASKVGFGFKNALAFKNAPIIWDSKQTAKFMYFINTDYLGFVLHPNKDFKMTEMRHRVDQHASVAHIQFMGNLTCSARRHQGVISNITV